MLKVFTHVSTVLGGSNTWGNGDLLALVINGVQPTFEVMWFLYMVLCRARPSQ